ncbi:uracil-DNA glycosylase [Roseomonas elaeocarpi]|uniref:Uracil-DNA glycosylase n=1 Tax=Roseomonas elaeocarpi TaxID=907779 RepID=A0ABV6JUG2_9PROT
MNAQPAAETGAGGPAATSGGTARGIATPAALANPAEVERRRLLLREPHMRALAALSRRLRRDTGMAVPDADPLDGGVAARVLILLETPGPAIGRTNFVSRDNATPTARNLRRFTVAAGLRREDTLIWNTIPFVIHAPGALNRSPKAAEVRAGVALLPPLLRLLPALRVVVLAGRVARSAAAACHEALSGVTVMEMPHPSPTIVCTSPEVPARILATLSEAAAILAREGVPAVREIKV